MLTLDLCLDVGNGVMEGYMFNLSCCVLFNLTWAYFLRYIVHGPVEESHGPFN